MLVNLLSSTLFLISLAVTYAATGTLTLAHLAERLAELPDHVSMMIQLLLLTTFAIKAAVFPLSLWLPDSYPTAPAPVTAVFAGLLTKVGVYAILRMQTLLFPDSPLTDLLLWAALLTMIIGILGAIAQSDIKRMLSFTLVSHIGYLILGIALDSRTGTAGTTFYVVHHITIQTALFLVLGLVERRAGSTALMRIGGLARIAPVLAVLFFVPAMNLAGIPPFSGFIGKVGLFQAAQLDGSPLAWTLVAAGAATSLLTLYAVAKTWAVAFWRTPREAHEALEAIGGPSAGRRPAGARARHPRGAPAPGPRPHRCGHRVATRRSRRPAASATTDEPDRDFYSPDRGGGRQPPLAALGMLLPRRRSRRGQRAAQSVVAGPLYALADRAAGDLHEPHALPLVGAHRGAPREPGQCAPGATGPPVPRATAPSSRSPSPGCCSSGWPCGAP